MDLMCVFREDLSRHLLNQTIMANEKAIKLYHPFIFVCVHCCDYLSTLKRTEHVAVN